LGQLSILSIPRGVYLALHQWLYSSN
jgi:hypothetical protein